MIKLKTILLVVLLGQLSLATLQATTYTVTNTDAGFTTGSLHWAVAQANNSGTPEPSKVVFDPSLDGLTITLDYQLQISRSNGVIIDASDLPGGITVSAATTRILYVNSENAVVHLRGLTFDGGKGEGNPTDGGGAIYSNGTLTATDCLFTNNASLTAGGAIWNTDTGTLMLERCVFSNNTATNSGGAIYNVGTIAMMHLCTFSDNDGSIGGAILNTGSLTATKSAFTDNDANGPGGGISSSGPLTLTQCSVTGNTSGNFGGGIFSATGIGSATVRTVLSRCTLSGNTAVDAGGGIHNQSGTTTLDHCTVSANTAPVDRASGVGARQSNFTEVIISNSIIAGNTNTDIDDTTFGGSSSFTSGGYNIVGTGGVIASFTNNDQVGVDPLLHPLADNGSLTPTMALQTGSPAIDAATTSVNTEDQRGIPVRSSPDIGAFESGSVVVTTIVDEFDTPSGPDVSLREALRDRDFGPSGLPVVFFANALAGQTITLTRGEVNVFDCIIDASPLAGGIIISGGDASLVMSTGRATLNQLTITGGSGGTFRGGGVNCPTGTVIMNDCTITGNNTTGSGGGIYASGAVIQLNRCTISNNTAASGAGGIYLQNGDQVTLTRCTVTGNTAFSGSAIWNQGSGGAVTLIHSTISQNITGATYLGAINLGRGAALTMENSIVADNGNGVDFSTYGAAPTITLSGANLIGKNTNVAAEFPADGILIGTSVAPVLPRLDLLADNGGHTRTMALQIGSPAIGNSIGSTSLQDQRGVDVVGVADIGAFETSALTVNTLLDELDVPAGPNLSLREALRDAASANATGIVFHRDLSGQTITLGGTQLLAESDIAIDASGLPEGITISGNQASRILEVSSTRYVTLRNLTLTGGFADGERGGAIYNSGHLNLFNVTISGNSAGSGGGIYIQFVGSTNPSTLTLTRCTISGNNASWGAGIFNKSTAVLNHCTVTANTSSFTSGPGIHNHFSSGPHLTINNCLVAGNSSGYSTSSDISANSGDQFTSLGANLIGDDSDVTGLTLDDIVNPAPLLAPLADNGGPTRTHGLLSGSPAINAAIATGDSADQRGFLFSGVADIGAFEADITNANLIDLSASVGAFDEVFSNSQDIYIVEVDYPIDTTTITPTASDPSAIITVNGSPVPSGMASDPIALALGEQTIEVVVTSGDSITSRTYRIYVDRSTTSDGDGDGITDLQEEQLSSLSYHYDVTDSISLDLATIFYPLPVGQRLVVTGLPRGVRFDAVSGLITGRILAELGNASVTIIIREGRTVVGSIGIPLIVSPYPFAGGYEALIENGADPVGKAKLTITGRAAFTATLELQGQKRRAVRGTVDNSTAGDTRTITVNFPAGRSGNPAATTVHFTVSETSDLVSGTESTNTLRGFRLARPSRIPGGNPALTMILPADIPGDRTSTPGGIGYANGKVNSRALASLRGRLGDAQAFAAGLNLSQTNQAVVWLTPYRNKMSYVGGIVDIVDPGAAGREASGDSETTGLQWKCEPDPRAKAYPDGFGPLALSSSSSQWVRAPQTSTLAELFRSLDVSYVAPTSDILPSRLNMRDNLGLIRIDPEDSVPFSGKAVAGNGIFAGNLTLPFPATRSAVFGVLLQDGFSGQGLVKIPISGGTVPGAFQTIGIRLQTAAPDPTPYQIGEPVNIDLSHITVAPGETLRVIGLPPGLVFNPGPSPAISGTPLGFVGNRGVTVQVLNGNSLVRSIPYVIEINNYTHTGNYEFLLEESGLPVGRLKISISNPKPGKLDPAFSATLERTGESRRSTRGSFTDAGGNYQTVRVAFPALRTYPGAIYDLSLGYDLSTSGDYDLLSGVTVPASDVTARGFWLVNPDGIPGDKPLLTMTFPPSVAGDRVNTPGGISYATGKPNTRALVPLRGMLGDAQRFTTTACISASNQAIVWATPYKNKASYIGGIMDLGDFVTPSPVASARYPNQTTGLKWQCLPDAKARAYPAGFGPLDLTGLASRWYPARKADAFAGSLGLEYRVINARYFSPTADPLPTRWTVSNNFSFVRTIPANSVSFRGRAVGTNGTFSASLQLPAPATRSAMSGVFLQDESMGNLIGQGLIKVPVAAPVRGSFETIGVELEN